MVASLAMDLVRGMLYIQSTKLDYHGNLKSSNCLLDSNWTLKVADFGLHELRNAAKDPSKNERDYYFGKSNEIAKSRFKCVSLIIFEILGFRFALDSP